MEEFEDDNDIKLIAPLDTRYVFVGLSMLIFGLLTIPFVENIWIKYFGFFCLLASLFVMTKKDKRRNLQ
jgi:hypothetical protein